MRGIVLQSLCFSFSTLYGLLTTSHPSTNMSRSRRQTSGADSFDKLSEGVKYGLQRLVNENAETVKQMLSATKTASATELCELCAQVMQQQQLSPSSFLARFFDATILAAQCSLLGKSSKGNAPALAERIASAWLKLKTGDLVSDVTSRNLTSDEGKKREIELGLEAETEPEVIHSNNSKPRKKAKTTSEREYVAEEATGNLDDEHDEEDDYDETETEEEHEDLICEGDEEEEDDEKLNWSGLPGGQCGICGRRSENVGPRRGFNYVDEYCGGCVG